MGAFTIQYLIIGSLFVMAVYYLLRKTRRSIKGKPGCSKGCGCEHDENTKKAIY